ncbi:YcgN family cysteine cluster protein [Paraferrimonas sp. SM1919]|uniref:YcgN family cysteine cluster protein n=1 Tax=Paraferrimonas sp. SM1919 TaxID=2662263 RepID=UPI0013D50FE6|nr:YcgN family cysteine cluster protein [Paraferrimonas sp. SM1919]
MSKVKKTTEKFWEHKTLAQMNPQEWEALCDGCGKCCLHKVIDDETEELYYTEVGCKLLDCRNGNCSNYPQRFEFVPDCTKITLDNIDSLTWLPKSCAYVRINEGRGLASWHPLIAGDKRKMHKKHISVQDKAIDERQAGELQDHIVMWPLLDR